MSKPKWHSEKRLIADLIPAKYNPRELTEKQAADLGQSLDKFGLPEPVVVNLNNVIIGGHQRINLLKLQGETEVDVRLPDRQLNQEEEVELNLRLNKNTGQWDLDALANMDEELLQCVGFTSEELDNIFELDLENPEIFDLEKELKKLEIEKIEIQKGDILQLGEHRMLCGDSTIEADILRLMGDERADMCFTDPPYILAYMQTKYKGKGPGFGYRRNRKYLETEEVPDDFTTLWMANIAKIQKWEPYRKGNKFCPTDFIDFIASSEEQTGQNIVFGCKPIEILIPYIKVLTKRDAIVIEPFGGSGSTLIACEKMKRRCRLIEKVPTYCEVIKRRWENYTGQKAIKMSECAHV